MVGASTVFLFMFSRPSAPYDGSLLAYLLAHLLACHLTRFLACLIARLPHCLLVRLPGCPLSCFPTFPLATLPLPACLLASCLHFSLHSCVNDWDFILNFSKIFSLCGWQRWVWPSSSYRTDALLNTPATAIQSRWGTI